MSPVVAVPAERLERWVLNFNGRHGATALLVVDGALRGAASDGSSFTARLPFEQRYVGLPDAAGFAAAAVAPASWGLLLVRKGGFAVARLAGDTIQESKVGQRHVQGRTKAGGQSSTRFARRRANQARVAYEAAADHAARILGPAATGSPVSGSGPGGSGEVPVVTGGDHGAVEDVLADPRLARLRVLGPWLALPDPRRTVLDQAVRDAACLQVEVDNRD